jgi:phage terminase small subunit
MKMAKAKRPAKNTTSKKKRKFSERAILKTVEPEPDELINDPDLEGHIIDESTGKVAEDEPERDLPLQKERNPDKFPSPKKHNKVFSARWKEYIGDVVKRENFKRGHLAQLEILCDLYVEYEKLTEDVKKFGYTYKSVGRNGTQYKLRPEIGQLNRTRAEIRSYSKTLGLLLVKDKDLNLGQEGEETWD